MTLADIVGVLADIEFTDDTVWQVVGILAIVALAIWILSFLFRGRRV